MCVHIAESEAVSTASPSNVFPVNGKNKGQDFGNVTQSLAWHLEGQGNLGGGLAWLQVPGGRNNVLRSGCCFLFPWWLGAGSETQWGLIVPLPFPSAARRVGGLTKWAL